MSSPEWPSSLNYSTDFDLNAFALFLKQAVCSLITFFSLVLENKAPNIPEYSVSVSVNLHLVKCVVIMSTYLTITGTITLIHC